MLCIQKLCKPWRNEILSTVFVLMWNWKQNGVLCNPMSCIPREKVSMLNRSQFCDLLKATIRGHSTWNSNLWLFTHFMSHKETEIKKSTRKCFWHLYHNIKCVILFQLHHNLRRNPKLFIEYGRSYVCQQTSSLILLNGYL